MKNTFEILLKTQYNIWRLYRHILEYRNPSILVYNIVIVMFLSFKHPTYFQETKYKCRLQGIIFRQYRLYKVIQL